MPYTVTDPLFEILKNSAWWKVNDLQDFFKQIRLVDSDYGLRIINEDWRASYLKESYKYTSTAPFTEKSPFGNGMDDLLYICESIEGWGSSLSQLRAGFLIKNDHEAYVEIMKAVNLMESKLTKLEGVYNRDKFEAEFELCWLESNEP